MVLYYNQVSVPLADTPDPTLLLAGDLQKSPSKVYTIDTPQTEIYQENRGLLENLSNTLFGDTLELHSVMLKEDFANLSIDEKMNYLFKANMIQGKIVSKYLRLVLFILILIVFKLYF
jgi:hypothetical protein